MWKLRILVGLTVSFWFGGFVSMYAGRAWRSHALQFNAFIFLFLFTLIVGFLAHILHVPWHRALRGTWHWQRTLHQLNIWSQGDGSPKPDEVLANLFADMDWDGDGYIGAEELRSGLEQAGCTDLSPSALHDMFRVCDRNGDNRMDR